MCVKTRDRHPCQLTMPRNVSSRGRAFPCFMLCQHRPSPDAQRGSFLRLTKTQTRPAAIAFATRASSQLSVDWPPAAAPRGLVLGSCPWGPCIRSVAAGAGSAAAATLKRTVDIEFLRANRSSPLSLLRHKPRNHALESRHPQADATPVCRRVPHAARGFPAANRALPWLTG